MPGSPGTAVSDSGCGILSAVGSLLAGFGGNGRVGGVQNERTRDTSPNPGQKDEGPREKEVSRRSKFSVCQTGKLWRSLVPNTNSGLVSSRGEEGGEVMSADNGRESCDS